MQSVDLIAGMFTLSGGTVVRQADDTVIEQDGDLLSLAAAPAPWRKVGRYGPKGAVRWKAMTRSLSSRRQ